MATASDDPSLKRSSSYELLPPNMSELRVVLLGNNWSEKNSVVNLILDQNVFNIELTSYMTISGTIKDKDVVIINTPDRLLSDISHHEQMKFIRDCSDASRPGPHVFLLVLQPEDCTEEHKQRIESVLENFSDQSFNQTLVLISPRKESPGLTETYRQRPAVKDMIRRCRYRHLQLENLDHDELLTRLGQIVKENNGEHLSYEEFKETPSPSTDDHEDLQLMPKGFGVIWAFRDGLTAVKPVQSYFHVSRKNPSFHRFFHPSKGSFFRKSIACEQTYSIVVSPAMASDSFQFAQTSLEWQTWTGSIPNGAVSSYNETDKRTEYVAKCGLEPGFYCPSLDHYCHFSYGCYEHQVESFDILVNKDNFEFLEWKPGSYGNVPENAVKTIQGKDTYVGRAKYGLGKVHASHKVFYHPRGGKEHSYKQYEVLTFSRDIIKEEIVDVKYKVDGVQIIQHPPEIISQKVIENRSSHPAKQTSQLTESITESNSWSINTNLAIGTSATFTAGIPLLGSTEIGTIVEFFFGYNQGSTQTKSKSESFTVEVEVPPKHSCSVKMEADMLSADIPFTAQLRRTYRNGQKTSTTITGTYKGVQVAVVRSVVDPCVPLKLY